MFSRDVLMLIYHVLWTLVCALWAPIGFLLGAERFRQRTALDIPPGTIDAGCIWVHALSVGEVLSALPLIEALKKRHPGRKIVFTVTTTKGMAVAEENFHGKIDGLLFMPIDLWWSMKRMVRHIQPWVFIIVETDLWPGLLVQLAKRGTPAVLVNGRVSPRTLKQYKRFPLFVHIVFEQLSLCLVQSELDRMRLLEAGVEPERVKTAGNIKFDRKWRPMEERERGQLRQQLRLGAEVPVWIAGSTHLGEEGIVLETHKRLLADHGGLCLIVAPRRVDDAPGVLLQAADQGLRAVLRTDLQGWETPYDVLILDTLGELGRVYGIGMVSFVGGSLVPLGGHNLLEPAAHGCPVLFGPHTQNFVMMAEALLAAGGGRRVQDGEDLYRGVYALLGDPEKRHKMGSRAKRFVAANRGAVERVMSWIDAVNEQGRAFSEAVGEPGDDRAKKGSGCGCE